MDDTWSHFDYGVSTTETKPQGQCAGSGERALYDGESTMGLRYMCPVCRRLWVLAPWWGHNNMLVPPVTPVHYA